MGRSSNLNVEHHVGKMNNRMGHQDKGKDQGVVPGEDGKVKSRRYVAVCGYREHNVGTQGEKCTGHLPEVVRRATLMMMKPFVFFHQSVIFQIV